MNLKREIRNFFEKERTMQCQPFQILALQISEALIESLQDAKQE